MKSHLILPVIILVSFAFHIGAIAADASNANDQKKRIEALATKSTSARSAADYTHIIDQCAQLLDEKLESSQHETYLRRMMSWSLNRRGEIRLELSKQFRRVENHSQADQAAAKALEDFEGAIQQDENRWRAFLNRGVVKCQKMDFENALPDFEKAAELNPKATNAWFNQAEINYELQKYDAALAAYQETLDLSPGDLQAMTGHGHTLFQLGRLDEALKEYDLVIKLKGNSAWALANRAELHQATGDFQAAFDDYKKAVGLEPIGAIYQRFAWMLATCPDDEFFQPEAALALIQKAITLDGESATNLDTLAAAYAAGGDFELAQQVQARAIAKSKHNQQFKIRKAMYDKNEIFQETVIR